MKEYTIELSEEKKFIASDGDLTSEIGISLQIWQDLVKMNPSHQEDILVKKILEQILEKEFNGVGNIPTPEYYK
tara:strand:- start:1005 stop:1226 length:222 start_codon:yes stop_codon:yes gene_type:complete